MHNFWRFLFRVFHYWPLLTVAFVASLIDALCAFSGLGALTWLIDQLLAGKRSVRQLALDKIDGLSPGALRDQLTTWAQAYIPGDPFQGFLLLVGAILALTLVGSVMRYIHQVYTANAVTRTIIRLRLAVYRRVLGLHYEQFALMGPADIISRVGADCGSIVKGIRVLMGKTVRNVLMGVMMLLLALLIDWKLTLLFLLVIPPMGLLIRKFGKAMQQITRRTLQHNARMVRTLQETLLNHEIIKLHQAEGYARRRLHRALVRRMLHEQLQAAKVRAITPPAVELLSIFAVTGVAVLAAWYIFTQNQDPTALIKVLIALALGAQSFKQLADINNELHAAAAAADRVAELLALPQEQKDSADLVVLPRHARSIRFEAVKFAYPRQEHLALKGIDLEIEHGMTVALVGPNGAGKSTLVNLLPRLIDATEGRVLIDGVDISRAGLRSLRRQIAVVSQQSVLFQGTLARNIALGRQHASREQVIAAARAAYADEFITALPKGYESTLTEGGVGLSGGQRQRICIARAILRDPAILILDEATSQVDSESEAKINAALNAFRRGRTTFTIAHRLSTVMHADLIVVMHDGRILDTGTHDQLLRSSNLYRSLCNTQLIATDVDAECDAPSR